MTESAFDVPQGELFLNLRPAAVNQYNPHAHRCKERNIMGKAFKFSGFHQFAGETHHKCFVAKGVNVGCNRSQP